MANLIQPQPSTVQLPMLPDIHKRPSHPRNFHIAKLAPPSFPYLVLPTDSVRILPCRMLSGISLFIAIPSEAILSLILGRFR